MKYRLGNICKIGDGLHGTPNYCKNNEFYFINGNNLKGELIDLSNARSVSKAEYLKYNPNLIPQKTVLLSINGTLGNTAIYNGESIILSKSVAFFECSTDIITPEYLKLYFESCNFQNILNNMATGTTIKNVGLKSLRSLMIDLPSINIQREIVNIIKPFENKLYLNNQINDNLEKLNRNFFRHIFGDQKPINKASDIANIKIGKTPPRKQNQWFSFKDGYKWLSIKDMKREGAFAFYAEEHLTEKAIQKFNIQVVPQYTVMVSFKLTIGRVKISIEDMVTNEAIAQFKDSTLPYEFLYTYLDNFPFETLGSTSSIAKAINSKILKSMPILVPKAELLSRYMIFAKPIFAKIFELQNENIKLNILKETLLNKYF
ncbi:restriction endonuclease subunit S [Limosilactobacillus sp. DJ3M12]|uniref:restriction endonuclease subunit S n=1 Tax=Limosilactobacillus sp. DJ3M12 TaxID=2991835 RepID=UPI0024BAF0A0|nr:restriction endonuclease subunit S [Limosilactobacillus sp. DJ3M12]